MSERKITFPVVGKGIRRNAETGVEIRSSKLDRGGMEHTVYYPTRDRMQLVNYFETLAGAREEAADRAQEIRDLRDVAHSDAEQENAHREALAICASIPVDGRPAAVTALLVEAELLTDAVENLRLVKRAAALFAEVTAPLTEYARKQFPSVAAMIENAPAGSAHGPADLRDAEDRAAMVAEATVSKPSMSDADVAAEARRIVALIPAERRTASETVCELIVCARWARTPADALYFAHRAAIEAEIDPANPPTDATLAAVTANFRRFESLRHRPTNRWVRLVGQPRRDPDSGHIVISVLTAPGQNATTVSVHSLDSN